ncbi:MAG: tripartite tricarboxylate transporter substrate binding protein [Betaproteobacteria bacterium]|nr:tripartite tricarboxylate transporter substrate binding protein [Betaproteobacteria bacterium]
MFNLLRMLAASAAALLLHDAVLAQAYPSRPVRIVVPFGNGTPDALARLVGQQLGTLLGQPVVIDNHPGANGLIGSKQVAMAAPDGYTLLLTTSSIAINPSIYKKMPFDVLKDFSPVTRVAATEALVLAVNPGVPANSARELLAMIARPDSKVSYGSPGVGNLLHLAGELFNAQAGFRAVHVPYNGSGPSLSALLAGDVQFEFLTPPLSLPYLKSGKLRALGYTFERRSPLLPAVPTMREQGIEGMEVDGGWFGLYAPAGTPAAIVDRLQAEVKKAVADPATLQRMRDLAFEPVASTPAESKRMMAEEVAKFRERVKVARIQPE